MTPIEVNEALHLTPCNLFHRISRQIRYRQIWQGRPTENYGSGFRWTPLLGSVHDPIYDSSIGLLDVRRLSRRRCSPGRLASSSVFGIPTEATDVLLKFQNWRDKRLPWLNEGSVADNELVRLERRLSWISEAVESKLLFSSFEPLVA